MLLRHVTVTGRGTVDVRLDGGTIQEIATTVPPRDAETTLDLDGFLLLPAPVEPHAHLDKALTADLVPNASGDLLGAIAAWTAFRPHLTHADVVDRATRAARIGLAHGCTAIRTHVDVAADIGVKAVEALAEVKKTLAGVLDLQIVALVSPPMSGRIGATHRALLREAMECGADVVGGCPHIDADPAECIDHCVQTAVDTGRPLDLHMDETLNPEVLDLLELVAVVVGRGFPHGVTASHCVSLGMQPLRRQRQVAEQVAAAGIAVVTLPQTNLYLQARHHNVAKPRGLTALRALLDAGVTMGAGGDNVQDPFNLMGRGDPLETASLLVSAGHLRPDEGYAMVTAGARAAIGLPTVEVAEGSPAELLALRATTVRDAMASQPPDRVVIHQGRVVARSRMPGP